MDRIFLGIGRVVRIAAGLLWVANAALAANHYVRPGAAGNGRGTDWDNAFTAMPSDLVRGDTYFIANGNYNHCTLNTPAQGNLYITIKKATATAHGTDAGWAPAFGDSLAVFETVTFSSNYWVLDGGKKDTLTSGHGIRIASSQDVGACITLDGSVKYITMRFLEVMGVDMSTRMTGVQGSTEPSYLIFQDIHFHNFFGCSLFIIGSDHVLIENCALVSNKSTAEWHSEGIQARGVSNLTVRRNLFKDINGTGCIVSGSGNSSNWFIYNNLVVHSNIFITDNYLDSITHVYVYNNTIANCNENGIRLSKGIGENKIWNNLFYNIDWLLLADNAADVDYNYFVKVRTPIAFKGGKHESPLVEGELGNYSTINSDPFVNSGAGDFHLAAPLVDYPGVPLAAPFDTDMEGRKRGADGVWDRGAYEFDEKRPVKPPLVSAIMSNAIDTDSLPRGHQVDVDDRQLLHHGRGPG